MRIVEEKVKPQRMKDNREVRKRYWWRFGETTPALFAAVRGLERVLVISRVTQYFAFVFLPSNRVYSERLVVIPLTSDASFAAMQSRVHELWALFFGPTHVDRPTYAPERCFETFPFPEGVLAPLPDGRGSTVERAGREYYEFRAALMVQNNEGLTKTYNRFHDPNERSPDILRLRELHAAMDRAVLDAYGWTDLTPTCAFLLDYEDEEGEEEATGRQRKKPWRYRWPDDFHDEVLAGLLELNKRRAEQERLAGPAQMSRQRGRKRRAGRSADTPDLF
jgi:hypothetical protein